MVLNFIAMERRLTQDKALQFKRISQKISHLQSLIWLLYFACVVIATGRAYFFTSKNRLVDLTERFQILRISYALQGIQCWLQFILYLNCKSVFHNDIRPSYPLNWCYIYIRFCCHFSLSWFAAKWLVPFKQLHITVLYLFPIVLVLKIWGPTFQNHQKTKITDNEGVTIKDTGLNQLFQKMDSFQHLSVTLKHILHGLRSDHRINWSNLSYVEEFLLYNELVHKNLFP